MYTFLHKKQKSSSEQLFVRKFVRCTPLINIFGSKSRTHTQQNIKKKNSSTSYAHFV